MRLFIAVPLPDDIAQAAARLLQESPSLRTVKPEQMHVTLAFLGATPGDRLRDASDAAEAAASASAPFAVVLDGPGRFPERGRPHTVWLGASTGADELTALGRLVRGELDARRVPYDEKPLRAHVTLGRLRENASGDDARAIGEALSALHVSLRFRIDRVVVFESVLSPKGPQYTARATASLGVGGTT